MGETINSLHKTTLIPGGSEVIVYTTLSGTVGIMVPFTSREVRLVSIMHVKSSCCVDRVGYRLLSTFGNAHAL